MDIPDSVISDCGGICRYEKAYHRHTRPPRRNENIYLTSAARPPRYSATISVLPTKLFFPMGVRQIRHHIPEICEKMTQFGFLGDGGDGLVQMWAYVSDSIIRPAYGKN